MLHAEKRLYLVFEYVDLDLKRHFDSCPAVAKDRRVIKARTAGGANNAVVILSARPRVPRPARLCSGTEGPELFVVRSNTCTRFSRASHSATPTGVPRSCLPAFVPLVALGLSSPPAQHPRLSHTPVAQSPAQGPEAAKPAHRPQNQYAEVGGLWACTRFWHPRPHLHSRGAPRGAAQRPQRVISLAHCPLTLRQVVTLWYRAPEILLGAQNIPSSPAHPFALKRLAMYVT